MKCLIFFCFLLGAITTNAQEDIAIPPYKRYPTLPPIQLLLGDSITKYTKENIPKKTPVLVMMFSPECSHCQHTAEEMYKNKEALKDIQIIMATILPLYEMNDFMKKYKLNEMDNVVAGKDIYFILPPFYAIKNFPYMAMYNKKGNLIMGFEGSMPVEKLLAVFEDSK
jgi:thioredoxin-related protein